MFQPLYPGQICVPLKLQELFQLHNNIFGIEEIIIISLAFDIIILSVLLSQLKRLFVNGCLVWKMQLVILTLALKAMSPPTGTTTSPHPHTSTSHTPHPHTSTSHPLHPHQQLRGKSLTISAH